MLSTKTLLRLVALLLAIFAIAHTYGALWFPSRGPAEDALFASMRQFTFAMFGVERTHWQFYRGFALFLSVNVGVLVLFVWQLSSLSGRRPLEARPFAVTLLGGTVGFALLSWWFFFRGPAVVLTAAAVLVGVAVYRLYEHPSPPLGERR